MSKGKNLEIIECLNCLHSLSKEKILTCARCSIAIYCSKECQIQHWKSDHKLFCKPIKNKNNNSCIICKLVLCCKECESEHIRKNHPEYYSKPIDKCVICLENIKRNELFTSECYHQFHIKCIKEIQNSTNKCPICRLDLSLDVDDIIIKIKELYKKNKENNKFLINKLIKSINDLADRNNCNAQYYFGCIHMNGIYINQDYNIAIKYLIKAADQNHVHALNALGCFYLDKKYINQDYIKALEYFNKAAVINNADALNNIGIIYQNGFGVEQDYKKAFEYFIKAADQDHIYAQNNVGILYNNGLGVEQNYKMAFEYFSKAAKNNYKYAQYFIGKLYENGHGS